MRAWTGTELQIVKSSQFCIKIHHSDLKQSHGNFGPSSKKRAPSFVYKTNLLKYPVAFQQGHNLICVLNTLMNVFPVCWKSSYYQEKNLSTQIRLQYQFIVLKWMRHNGVTALRRNSTRS